MLSLTPKLVVGLLAGQAFGTVHHMFSGVFGGSDLYAIEFDDEANTLTPVSNITSNGSSSKWIAIDALKKNIYVGNGAQFDSYTITNSTGLEYASTVNMTDGCSNANYIIGSTAEPYVVFGAPYSTGCAARMITIDSTGALESIEANITYASGSGVHGLAVSADNKFVYSADDMGNAVWVHSFNTTTGSAEEVQYLAAPTGADPRHMIVHPQGGYAYVVFEAASEIGVYTRDNTTGELTYTNTTYPLLPTGYTNTSSYWADEVQFSYSEEGKPKYMYAATRSRTTTIPGQVSAFALDTTTGAITSQLFLTPTTASGGSSNSVTAALWAEEYFAITDSGSNFVEMWKITVNNDTTSATASVVAHMDMDTGPANIVMYD